MLEGQLVRLRALEQSDLEREHRWMNDPEVVHWIGALRYPVSRTEEERWLRDVPGNSFSDGVRLAIETKDGEHIGNIMLLAVRTEDRKAELAVIIGEKDRWSQGYGGDAVVTLLRFAFQEMNLNRVWLMTVEYNERALACYRKCGFVEEGRLREEVYKHGRHWDYVAMGVLRQEFEALHGSGPAAEGGSDA